MLIFNINPNEVEIDLKKFMGAENYSNIEKLCKKNMEKLGLI